MIGNSKLKTKEDKTESKIQNIILLSSLFLFCFHSLPCHQFPLIKFWSIGELEEGGLSKLMKFGGIQCSF